MKSFVSNFYDKVYIDKNSCSFVRDDNQVGENAILTLRGIFWNDDFGEVQNSLSVSYRFKKTTSSTWIDGTTTITPITSDNDFTFTGQIASDNNDTTWDLDASYNLEVIISDELSSASIELILNSAVPTLSLDKEGVGVLCAYDSSLGGKLQIDGKRIDDYVFVRESGVINSNQMTSGTVGSDAVRYYDLIFTKTYTNPPTILTTFISTAGLSYYGWVKTYVVNYTNTSARLVLGNNLNDTIGKLAYIVISND